MGATFSSNLFSYLQKRYFVFKKHSAQLPARQVYIVSTLGTIHKEVKLCTEGFWASQWVISESV